MKKCTKCGEVKDRTNFLVEPKRYDGLSPWCRSCRNTNSKMWKRRNIQKVKTTVDNWRKKHPDVERARHLKKKYNITISQYDLMLESQSGRCAICHSETPGGRGCFHVDHDHDTGRVRGLLCSRCNQGIGLFLDSETIVLSALYYLKLHNQSLIGG